MSETDRSSLLLPPLSRRRFLGLGLGAAALALAGGPAWAGTGERRLAFLNLHTGEFLQTTYWQEGSYLGGELAAINRVLRDHHNDAVGTIDPHLLDLLAGLQQRTGGRRTYQVISGYRSPETNAQLRRTDRSVAKNSLHMAGRAIDVRLPHGELEKLMLAARDLKGGGVGYYPASKFLHLDVGQYRTWNG